MNRASTCAHYRGESGARYFDWQREIGALGGLLNLYKFAPYVRDDAAVCDFGCGGGFLLARLPGRQKVGVEVNPDARRAATERGLWTVESASELPDAHFDVIVSNHALEHTRRPLDELGVLRGKLKVGGLLICCVPVDDWRNERAYDRTDINHHLYTWTPQLLGNLATEAGYTVRSVRVLRYAWSPRLWRAFRWNRWLFDLACRVNAVMLRRYQVLLVAMRAT